MLTNRCFCAVAVVLGLGAFASSCSTEPGGSTQTSADGGDDAGIDAGPAPCTSDAECDDGRYCNGEETCDAGFCADGAKVVCDDGIECTVDVCSEAERACVSAAPDKDGDGKGDIHCVNADNEPLGDDCDDNDANRFPGNVEVCDQGTHDEDCNPETFGRVDNDGDTFYSAACCNVGPDDTMYCGTDCDDVRSNVNPNATEACDGFDNDCDSTMDEGVGIQLYPDLDGDGHGDENAVPVLACAGAARLSNVNDDCNDGDPAIHGTQLEICDGKDNNCNDEVDEVMNFVTWYRDADGDGYGNHTSGTTESCVPPVGYSLVDNDCDDNNAAISPLAAEICDGKDNDCNGLKDYQIGTNNYEDDDDDGLVDSACPPLGTDCDDTNAATGPAGEETCDGRDNDCDDLVDEGAMNAIWYSDRDGDGYGAASSGSILSCQTVPGYVRAAGDCNDSNANRHPGAAEKCNLADEDCDGAVDESPANTDCTGKNHATAKCSAGQCVVDTCDPGYGDCKNGLSDGCETSLGTVSNCGGCGDRCIFAGAFGVCGSGQCHISGCNTFLGNCNLDDSDGCETSLLDLANCGACGNACDFTAAHGNGSCHPNGGCQVDFCDFGYSDCIGDPIGSCETNTNSDVNNCGHCGNSCLGYPNVQSASCSAGQCSLNSCVSGYVDCNLNPMDGCESNTSSDVNNCGGCYQDCFSLHPGTQANWQCAGGSCKVQSCPGTSANCDGNDTNGCERDLNNDVSACGSCATNCNSSVQNSYGVRCNFGLCAYDQCQSGFSDCDGSPANGCEKPTNNDANNCGGCNIKCSAGAQCTNGMCEQFKEVAVGTDFSCAIYQSGGLVCWGSDAVGQFGNGVSNSSSGTPVFVPGNKYVHIAAGGQHACGVTAAGQVYCWGQNANGEVGNNMSGPPVTSATFVSGLSGFFEAVSVGNKFSCASNNLAQVYCWGDNGVGQIGNGSNGGNVLMPFQVADGSSSVYSELSAGSNFIWARDLFSAFVFWGANPSGQGAYDSTVTSEFDYPNPGLYGTGYTRLVQSGGAHACRVRTLTTTPLVECWGLNGNHQLGHSATPTYMPAVAWSGQVVDLHLGDTHTCALEESGNGIVWCWGDNGSKQTAQASAGDTTAPSQVVLSPQPFQVSALSKGPTAKHSCAVADGSVYCWGDNTSGQLGRGSVGGNSASALPIN